MPTRRIRSRERRRCPQACRRCKRRKERCDGSRPCGRCVGRAVGADCTFGSLLQSSPGAPEVGPSDFSSDFRESSLARYHDSVPSRVLSGEEPSRPNTYTRESPPPLYAAPVAQQPRLIQDGQGTFLFIGDAAHLAFLQVIRRMTSASLGSCRFADDPLRHYLVEETPRHVSDWVAEAVHRPPAIPDSPEIEYFVSWFLRATDCVLNIFDGPGLYADLSRWLRKVQEDRRQDVQSAIFFLVFAIGAQACPEDRDGIADRYFDYGRLITMTNASDCPSTCAVRANVLITMYLLGSSRRNAAFVYLGTAVRTSYALGIHRKDINALFSPIEFASRERLWKALRVLDLFMSASLGRPPSTYETRDTTADADYSPTNDLSMIFETILTQVYSKRVVSTTALRRVSDHHRQWAARFMTGLATDSIRPSEFLGDDAQESTCNVGILHLKEAYYWTIMLISRPFLIEKVSRNLEQADKPLGTPEGRDAAQSSNEVLSNACVDSAVRTVELLRGLLSAGETPKRLPFVVNSLFSAALVLGLAQFGDMDRSFPLDASLVEAQQLLFLFSKHDAIARRNMGIVERLREACGAYVTRRAEHTTQKTRDVVAEVFGSVHDSNRPEGLPAASNLNATAMHTPQASHRGLASATNTGEDSTTFFDNSMNSNEHRQQSFAERTDESHNSPPDLTSVTEPAFPVSPGTLIFDSIAENIPLFSTLDASLLGEDGPV